MPAKNIPFEFIFDYLVSGGITVKPVFGMFYVYAGGRIVLILRQRENEAHINGIWLATGPQHHKSLRKDLPALCSFSACGGKAESGWLLLPAGSKDFEEAAIQLCRFIMYGDKRIGRVPNNSRKKKSFA